MKNGHSKKKTQEVVNTRQKLMLLERQKPGFEAGTISFSVKKVIKSSGKVEEFSWEKLERSIIAAGKDTKSFRKKKALEILQRVKGELSKVRSKTITSSEVRDLVEPVIADMGYFQTARYYILYKERKEIAKKEAFRVREPKMTKTSEMALINRCSRQNETGEYLETPGEIFWRTAKHMAKAEFNWGNEADVERVARLFFNKMADFKFVCTTSALYESGNPDSSGQLSPCFVLKIEDSISSIFATLGEAALIQKNFGGTGFNFSRIRMHGDRARGVPNSASGPVDFLQVYSAALSKVMQGAKKHGGNMGILNVNHPDIEKFISVKDADGTIKNFNISVGVTNEFMEAVSGNKNFSLVNPRNGAVVKKVNAKKLFKSICEHAWATGDPGMIFLDRMEEDNFTPTLGKLDATNPCGEQPLLPYESCNLSSIHIARHLIKNNGSWEMNWEELGETVRTLVRFLDNMIEVNTYVIPETEKTVKYGNRKIGLGAIGLAETLFKLGLPYNSTEGIRMAEKIAKFIRKNAEDESLELAKVRGVFPNWDISTYKGTAEKYRNCTMITIAPTGTVSMIGNTTSGIEPSFALVYTRRTFYNKDSNNNSTESIYYIDPAFEAALKEEGIYSKSLIKKIADNGGSIQGMKEIPGKLRKIFVTTHDIDPLWHIKAQAAFQKYADNSVSKTINFRESATAEDVEESYLLAWKMGCKGITIYRDGSKEDQVLSTKNEKKDSKKDFLTDTVLSVSVGVDTSCPECGGVTYAEGGCTTCRDCGWSKCKL